MQWLALKWPETSKIPCDVDWEEDKDDRKSITGYVGEKREELKWAIVGQA